jgi:hypothetical protein
MRVAKLFIFLTVVACMAGCSKTATDADGIRSAVTRHLASLNTLNLQAMDMDITNTSIQGNQASASVTFRPKTGAPAGASMQVSYQLEKQNGTWSVVQTGGVGGAINHPAPGANPHITPGGGDVHSNLPDVQGLLAPFDANAKKTLPPGHPPVKTPPPTQKQ